MGSWPTKFCGFCGQAAGKQMPKVYDHIREEHKGKAGTINEFLSADPNLDVSRVKGKAGTVWLVDGELYVESQLVKTSGKDRVRVESPSPAPPPELDNDSGFTGLVTKLEKTSKLLEEAAALARTSLKQASSQREKLRRIV